MSHNNPFIALYGVYLGNLDKQRINFPESIIIRGEEGDSLKGHSNSNGQIGINNFFNGHSLIVKENNGKNKLKRK